LNFTACLQIFIACAGKALLRSAGEPDDERYAMERVAHATDARRLEERIEALAEAYLANPSRGHEDGYWPMRAVELSDLSSVPELIRVECDRAAWLYGIARRELGAAWHWRVIQGVGCAAEVVISGPRSSY
jgi:hypothetical protein